MSSFFDTIIAGCAGGMAQVLAGQPFDMIKVRLQTGNTTYSNTSSTAISTRSTISDCLMKIIKNEGGLKALWKGSTSPLMSVGASVSIQFGVNEKTRALLMKSKGISKLNSSQFFMCGVIAGLANSIIAIPSEHSRIRMQVQSKGQMQYASSIDCIKQIFSQYGLRGLYKGGVPTVLREGTAFGIYFSFYEWLIQKMVKPGQTRRDLSISKVLTAGSATGVMVWLATFPIDVIKTKIQVDRFVNPVYNGMMDCMMKTYRADGIKGFYKGFTPCLLRAVPANGATFLAYEMTTQMLSLMRSKNV